MKNEDCFVLNVFLWYISLGLHSVAAVPEVYKAIHEYECAINPNDFTVTKRKFKHIDRYTMLSILCTEKLSFNVGLG